MRLFETLLLVLGVFLPFLISFKKTASLNVFLLVFTIGAFVAHCITEGLRWQMAPIYLTNIILMVYLSRGHVFFKGSWVRKTARGFFLFLLLGLGFSLSTILPVFDFPAPTGSHEVGSQHLHFVSDKEEYLTDTPGDKRELMVKVWYPADIEDEKKEVYFNEGERKGFAAKYGLPQRMFNYLDHVKTHTFESPSIAKGIFPILLFSHGYYANATGYQALIEEIVSHGYVVLNLNHTYESVGALFPPDEVKLYALDYDKKHNNQEMAKMVWEAMEDFKQATTKEEERKAINSTLKNYYAAEITRRWAEDISMIVNQVFEWEKSTFLSGHIDTSKIGVFGHSQGGAAAGQTLLDDPRISAGVNIDGTQWGNMIDTFLSKPFLLLSSDWPVEHPDFNEHAYRNGSLSDFYKAELKHSGHSNFMDIPRMINLSAVNEAGTIEPKKAIKITAGIVTEFFNKYLKTEETNLLEYSKQHPLLETKHYSREN